MATLNVLLHTHPLTRCHPEVQQGGTFLLSSGASVVVCTPLSAAHHCLQNQTYLSCPHFSSLISRSHLMQTGHGPLP